MYSKSRCSFRRVGERLIRLPILVTLAAGVAAGCTTVPARLSSAGSVPAKAYATVVEADPSQIAIDETKTASQPQRPIRNVLVLSSGGLNGAYPAGVLKGWSQLGTRPEFDVVTGVSTGALLGTLAFLGPDYDEAMERLYTTARPWDVFLPKPPVPWSDSLAVSRPLRNRIEREVTPEVLERVAAEHSKGRRLYVGTTKLETKQLVIWDMGAIACDPAGHELFRRVLLASCSIPGLLPPVTIETTGANGTEKELHVDGSVAASLFLRPSLLGYGDGHVCPAGIEGAHVYVLVAGKLGSEPSTIHRNLFQVSSESLHGVLQSRQEGDLLRTYLLCWHCGAKFHLTGIPQEAGLGSPLNSVTLGPKELRMLFDLGMRSAGEASAWLNAPPEGFCDEQVLPRDGRNVVKPPVPRGTRTAGQERAVGR